MENVDRNEGYKVSLKILKNEVKEKKILANKKDVGKFTYISSKIWTTDSILRVLRLFID